MRRFEHAPDGATDADADTELTVEKPLLELPALEPRLPWNEDEIEPEDDEIGGEMFEEDSADDALGDDALDEKDETPIDALEDEMAVEKEEARTEETEFDEAVHPGANWTLLSCHPAEFEEKLYQTTPIMALAFAPDHDVQGIVTVWVFPVRPETV